MDFLVDNLATILAIVTAVCGATISVVSFLKSLKSEKRTKTSLADARQDIVITRQGIVQGFKEAIVTKDLKISINNQVKEVLTTELDEFKKALAVSEARRTKMAYWCLRILHYTAASDKLTTERKSEIDELLAMIADEEQIVDTYIM